MDNLLNPGMNVTIVTKDGETLVGKVICRSGIGELRNYSPRYEEIILENNFGCQIQIPLSQIKDVK
mgnify:CR=1 FL=1